MQGYPDFDTIIMALAPEQRPTNFNMLGLFYTIITLCLGAKATWVAGDHLRPPGRGSQMRATQYHVRILWVSKSGQLDLYTRTRDLQFWVLEIIVRTWEGWGDVDSRGLTRTAG